MSKIKNGGLDQYGAEPLEQQLFGTAGVEGVNFVYRVFSLYFVVFFSVAVCFLRFASGLDEMTPR